MNKRVIKTDNAPAPVGPYSQAVVAKGFVFCSGQLALDPLTGKLISTDIESETIQVMENLKAVLDAAGSSLDMIVKTTIFLTNMDDFARVNQVYGRYFGKIPPARSTVEAKRLPKGASVEIDCIALLNE
jgi:2-iminobutanoate/2-iminopropanoate deaminase